MEQAVPCEVLQGEQEPGFSPSHNLQSDFWLAICHKKVILLSQVSAVPLHLSKKAFLGKEFQKWVPAAVDICTQRSSRYSLWELAPCTHLLCSGVTSARSAQEASHSNSSSWHLTDVPGASPAATAVPSCTHTGAQIPFLHRAATPLLLHSSPVLLSPCTTVTCGAAQTPKLHSLGSSSTSSGSPSSYRKFQLLKDFVQKAA